jgi:quercetin 2,3-dioxygenase
VLIFLHKQLKKLENEQISYHMQLQQLIVTTIYILFLPSTISFTAVNGNIYSTTTSSNTAITNGSLICPVNTIDSHINNMNSPVVKLRSVQKVLPRPSAHWVGDGFRVYPVFSHLAFTKDVSPLLMFDYAEPKSFPPSNNSSSNNNNKKPVGVGQHPHRGFETVTIAFQGEVEHHDNAGNTGIIKSGDVQWMTAGRGIIHEEYHSKNFTKTGGTFEMCQLWVNLPKKYKMTKPRYQGITNEQIPIVNLPLKNDVTSSDTEQDVLGTARIIAGDFGSTKGAATTFSPVQVWDVTLPKANSVIDIPYPPDQRCIVFVRRGSVEIIHDTDSTSKKNKILQPQEVGILHQDGSDTIRVRVIDPNSSILILGGEIINEPIAAQGPFVMNTQQEIYQAMSDYQSGKFAN